MYVYVYARAYVLVCADFIFVIAVRVISVKVIEAVERWRRVQEARAKAKARAAIFSKTGGKVTRMYSGTLC